MKRLKQARTTDAIGFEARPLKPLEGIVFSDPGYGPETRCRYDSGPLDSPGRDPWVIRCSAARFESGDGWSETRFYLALGAPAALRSIFFAEELGSFAAPEGLVCGKERMIGVGADSVYLGPSDRFPDGERRQSAEALYLAWGGYFGSAFELRDEAGEIRAVILLGQADAEVVSPGQLGDYLLRSFDAEVESTS